MWKRKCHSFFSFRRMHKKRKFQKALNFFYTPNAEKKNHFIFITKTLSLLYIVFDLRLGFEKI